MQEAPPAAGEETAPAAAMEAAAGLHEAAAEKAAHDYALQHLTTSFSSTLSIVDALEAEAPGDAGTVAAAEKAKAEAEAAAHKAAVATAATKAKQEEMASVAAEKRAADEEASQLAAENQPAEVAVRAAEAAAALKAKTEVEAAVHESAAADEEANTVEYPPSPISRHEEVTLSSCGSKVGGPATCVLFISLTPDQSISVPQVNDVAGAKPAVLDSVNELCMM